MEFRLTAANRVFIVLTLVGPFFLAAIALLPGFLGQTSGAIGGPIVRIALSGADTRLIRDVAPILGKIGIEASSVQGSADSLDSLLLSGAYDGYVILPAGLPGTAGLEYVTKDATDFRVLGALQDALGPAIVARWLTEAGIPASQVDSITRPPVLISRRLTRNGETGRSHDFLTVFMTGLIFAMMLYMTVLLYGQAVGRSVLSEKTNKTVEIMLSSVRPMDLLFGKILGKALASLLQYGIWVAGGLAFMKLVGPRLGVPVGFVLPIRTAAYLVLFFILAFFLYCSIYAALGAAAEDEQSLSQLAWPVVIFLIIPVVMISQVITAPSSPAVVALSFFPLTAPIIMFLRILLGAAQPWEILLSLALTAIATVAAVWLSSRIFRVGILLSGKRLTLRDLLIKAR